jgi:hypothetical protein
MSYLKHFLYILGMLALSAFLFISSARGQLVEPVNVVTWNEPASSTSDRLVNAPGLPKPDSRFKGSGIENAIQEIADHPDGQRWLLGTQMGNYIAQDGWVDGRENEHDRTIATTLAEDISSENRTSISVEAMPYDLPDGHELVIQTGDPSNPPLNTGQDRILAYVDGGVSSGATSIPIDDGNGNPVTITASSGDRVLSDYQSLWPIHAKAEIANLMQDIVDEAVQQGVTIDGVALDTELNIQPTKAIKHDPRWDDSTKGFVDGESMKEALAPTTIDDAIAQNGGAAEVWRREIDKRIQAEALTESVHNTVTQEFPDVKGSDWNKNGITNAEAQNAPNTDGKLTYEPHIYATHANQGLYASIRNLSREVLGDAGHTYGNSPWATLRWQVKFIRTMVRENGGAVQPWMPYRSLNDGFYVVNTYGPYFREHWIQMILHSDPDVPALYFNPGNSTDQEDIDVDGYLEDINEAVAGDHWDSVTTTDISWTTDLIATAVDLPNRRLWRVSVKRVPYDGTSPITVNVSNGDTITIPGGKVGTWYETGLNESPTFSYTPPPVDNLLPSDNWIDLTSSAWFQNPDNGGTGSRSGGISDPDGGTDAYRMQKSWLTNDVSVEPGERYTFSIWVKKGSGNFSVRVKGAYPFITFGQEPEVSTWKRTRVVFKAPNDGTVSFEIDAAEQDYHNNYFYQPMLNKGWAEGPYERPAKTVGASQTLSLQKGGNLVSSAVQPLGPDLETVLGSAAASIAKIKTEDGKVFEPDTGTDEIGTWDSSEAYKIYAEAPTSFSIEGIPLDGTEVSLGEGWNWLPYPDSTSVAINQALEPIQNDLVMVKDETGRVYRPAQGTDQIGSLQPGTAYKILLKNPVTLSYPLE